MSFRLIANPLRVADWQIGAVIGKSGIIILLAKATILPDRFGKPRERCALAIRLIDMLQ